MGKKVIHEYALISCEDREKYRLIMIELREIEPIDLSLFFHFHTFFACVLWPMHGGTNLPGRFQSFRFEHS
jgi:hypothetical protein